MSAAPAAPLSSPPLALPSQWRYLPYTVAAGTEQMERDRQLLLNHVAGLIPSTLRFYGWSTPTISLGYHQHHYPDHWNTLIWNGEPVPLVRRPTGGRAVLHQGGLTYAVVTSTVGTNREVAYQKLCQWLIDGFNDLGIPLNFGTNKILRSNKNNPNCFGLATGADLCLLDGTKVIGSAQVWRDSTVLQHGTILLNPDPALFETVFSTSLPRTTFTPWLDMTQTLAHDAKMLRQVLQRAAQQKWGGEWQEVGMEEAIAAEKSE
ncbi:MAG: lipoate--protein ligase family protein [Cyanophyceae cyanobacterium]